MKYTLNDIWDMYPDVSDIKIDYSSDYSLNSIELFKGNENVGYLTSELLVDLSFPPTTNYDEATWLERPILYTRMYLAFYQTIEDLYEGKFYFTRLIEIDNSQTDRYRTGKLSRYRYYMFPEQAMEIIKLTTDKYNKGKANEIS